MNEAIPPWNWPAARRAYGGGERRRLANHWKRWGAKPEAVGGRGLPMLVRLHLANQWKRWDSKV